MKDFKITIEGPNKDDASVFAAALTSMVRKLGVIPGLVNVDLGIVGRLIGDDWTLNNELGKIAKADENGIPGFGATIEVTQPGPDLKARVAELEKALDVVCGHIDTPDACRQIIYKALGIDPKTLPVPAEPERS